MRFIVSGASMEPSYAPGDRLFVSGYFYKLRNPRKGDVVVLADPRTGRMLLKRVTAVENGRYVVRGDNRKASTDSGTFGPVSPGRVAGKVLFRYRRGRAPAQNWVDTARDARETDTDG